MSNALFFKGPPGIQGVPGAPGKEGNPVSLNANPAVDELSLSNFPKLQLKETSCGTDHEWKARNKIRITKKFQISRFCSKGTFTRMTRCMAFCC